MSKNKFSKDVRRQKELLKAQQKNSSRISVTELQQNEAVRKKTHRLPLKVLKSNLLAGIIFFLFGLIFIVIFKHFGLESYFSVNK